MKIKQLSTGLEFEFATLDQALRTLKNNFDQPILTKVGRKTFSQALVLLKSNGYELLNPPKWAKIEPTKFQAGSPEIPGFKEKGGFGFPDDFPKFEIPAKPQVKILVEHKEEPKLEVNPMNDLAKLLGQMVDVESRTKKVIAEESKTIQAAVRLDLEQFKGTVKELVKEFKPMVTVVEVKTPVETKQMGVQHKNFPTLVSVLSQRVNCLMVGQAGSGKTMGAEKAAEALGLKYYTISVGAQTTKTEFFGYMDATGKYVRTLFREAFEFGGVFLLDEMDAGNANVIVSINQALANGITAFPDGMVPKHPDFILVATANTWGNGTSREYVGRNQLDASTLDRFAMIEWSYDEELEDSLVDNKKWLKEVRRIRQIVADKKIRTVISPRASITGSKLLAAGLPWDQVKEMLVLKSMNESERVLCK